jgi:hypothetical protein
VSVLLIRKRKLIKPYKRWLESAGLDKSVPGEENMGISKKRKEPVARRPSAEKPSKITYATLWMPNPSLHEVSLKGDLLW